jgi:hypothetical protein
MRRALVIGERSYGPAHPSVAIRLNNLAYLLRATGRPNEAEPLMRRAVAIAVKFTMQTGHRHPRLDTRLKDYKILLAELGKSQSQIDATCTELLRPIS